MSFNPSGSETSPALDIRTLTSLYQNHGLSPVELVDEIYRRIHNQETEGIWITLRSEAAVREQAKRLEQSKAAGARLPLYGLPYAVKDNIDVAGYDTTAACPEFAYRPLKSSTVVEKLDAAGALLIGKTNLDQFATGLVGTRSPYGVCRNPYDPAFIAGGSSAGSAVAVSSGLVSFSLGTDTAGSGRVPAGFNNIVGLKPSKGLLSTIGVVPACRSLDCVSVFAQNCEDAERIFEVCRGPDLSDPFSRQGPMKTSGGKDPENFKFGIPDQAHLQFFGNTAYEALFQQAVDRLQKLGGKPVEIDYQPFADTAELLYGGPWVAERLWVVQDLLTENPEAFHPITHQILEGAHRFSALDAYESYYQLKSLAQLTRPIWQAIDLLLVPTTGTHYTIAQIEAEPLSLNTNLGYYTNFVNLLDLCALAVPNGFQQNGLPVGVTLIAPAFQEAFLSAVGRRFERGIAKATDSGAR